MKKDKAKLTVLIIQIIGLIVFGVLLVMGQAMELLPITILGIINIVILLYKTRIFKNKTALQVAKIWAWIVLAYAIYDIITLFVNYGSYDEIKREIVYTIDNFNLRWFKLLIFMYQPLTILLHSISVFLRIKEDEGLVNNVSEK